MHELLSESDPQQLYVQRQDVMMNSSPSSDVSCCPLQSVKIVGVDPNPEMAPYAMEAAGRAGLTRDQLQVLDGTAEQIPVASQTHDAVICTLVGMPHYRC